jgi:cysteine desulfurase/selenocysteine lyase
MINLPHNSPPLPPLPANFSVAEEFPITRNWTFFNHAGVAPISARAAMAIERFAHEARDDSYLSGRWYHKIELVRKLAAEFICAHPEEISFVKNTSEGIAFVANGLDWKPGDEIISTAVEYPSNVYPWMDVAQRHSAKHIMLPETDGRIDRQSIFDAVTPRTRMIALSHVEYASGFRHDIAAIGQFCRSRGILLCVDGIQACGVLPVDVQAMNIDFLSADGHKWLLGPEGAGIFYCRKELLLSLRPEIGWMNVINASDYGHYDFTLRTDARRFECGSHNIPGVLALGASMRLLLDIGMETVTQRVMALTTHLCAGLEQKGYTLISSRRPDETSGIVSFKSRRHNHTEIISNLEKQKIILVEREGRLRASPHFYQSIDDINRLVAALPS